VLTASWNILILLAPWLLLGMVIAGLLHGFLPKNFSKRQLRGDKGVFKAVAVGVPLPLCSCGVIPAGLGLKKDGASDGASMAFLISTPQTGVDSTLVAYQFLGLPFALFKIASATLIGVVGGLISNRWGGDSPQLHENVHGHSHHGRGWKDMVDHGLDLVRTIWGWLVFGVLASAVITLYVPPAFFESLAAQGTVVACFAALAVSLPLYVCATASVPMAAAMVAEGMPPGAALVFLIAGPASNLATMGVIYRGFGARNLAIYLSTIIVGSIGLAIAFETLLNPATVIEQLTASGMMAGHHTEGLAHFEQAAWWETTSAVILLLLLAWFALDDGFRFLRRKSLHQSEAEQLTFPVGGMTCGGCSGKVEKALRSVDGVEQVVVDLNPGQVTVTGNASLSTLKEAVTSIGFTAE